MNLYYNLGNINRIKTFLEKHSLAKIDPRRNRKPK